MNDPITSGWQTTSDEALVPVPAPRRIGQRIEAPADAGDKIKLLAATGFSKIGIAAHFSVSLPTLQRWLDEDDALQAAFTVGRDAERYSLHNALYRRGMNGDSAALMFLLKARHGYREGDQQDQANKVQITFNLPGAVSADEYGSKTVINGNDQPKRLSDEPTFSTRRV